MINTDKLHCRIQLQWQKVFCGHLLASGLMQCTHAGPPPGTLGQLHFFPSIASSSLPRTEKTYLYRWRCRGKRFFLPRDHFRPILFIFQFVKYVKFMWCPDLTHWQSGKSAKSMYLNRLWLFNHYNYLWIRDNSEKVKNLLRSWNFDKSFIK